MKLKSLLLVTLVLLLLALIGNVRAQDVFVIQPSKGVTQSVQVTDGCQSIAGNVSVSGGVIDFCITDPSGTTILQFENVSFKNFSFNTTQNGTYIIDLTNRWSIDKVTVTLSYGRNSDFAFSETVKTWHDIAIWTMTIGTQSPLPIGLPYILEFVISVAKEIVVMVSGTVLGTLMLGFILKKIQKRKDGSPSKTPSTIRPPPSPL